MPRLRRCLVLPAVLVLLSTATSIGAEDGRFHFEHHAISTMSSDAQRLFDEGLTFQYAFNREVASARFAAAAAKDPDCAACWWGVALAHGPNINIDATDDDAVQARRALAKATAAESHASDEERALIGALAARYPADPKVTVDQRGLAYARAMQKVAAAYPSDVDVQAVFIDALMDVENGGATPAGLPSGDGLEAILAKLCADNPAHVGVLHEHIHVAEWVGHPERALDAARTFDADAFAPEASHLRHMSAHVYMHTGDWALVEHDDALAVAMDREQAATRGIAPRELDYYLHNLDFWYGGAVMHGDEPAAREAAGLFAQVVPSFAMVVAERYGENTHAAEIADSLKLTKAAIAKNARLGATAAIAYAQAGRLADARALMSWLPPAEKKSPQAMMGQLVAGVIAERAGAVAAARQAYASAATLQDTLDYEEAQPWYWNPRERWAAMELDHGDATAAARIARQDLERHPHGVPAQRILDRALAASSPAPAPSATSGERG